MIAEVILRAPYDRLRRKFPKTEQRPSLAEQIVLNSLTVGLFALPLVYSLTGWLRFADYPTSPRANTALGGLGIVFMAATLWLFWRSHYDLGANWSPTLEINAQQTLVTRGIYRFIRHPMYASSILWGIAQILLLHNWIAGWGGLLVSLILYGMRVPPEERMMLDHFGDEYRAYCARTGRVLPRI